MERRFIGNTELETSVVGFGVWTIATGWWGSYTEDEAVDLLRYAYDKGITFFNTSNVYGEDGYGEKLVAKALSDVREHVTIATTFGYDVDAPREGSGHRERPHDWSADNLRRSLERSLENLGSDSIDMWQLHNPRMDAMQNDALWDLLADLKSQGMVKSYGPSLGPAIGWADEGRFVIRERQIDFFHQIYNLLEQDPGRELTELAAERDIAVLARVPHSSGLLEDKYTSETTFDASDHRSHRSKEWLEEGLQKVASLRPIMEGTDMTMGQLAINWLLADPAVVTVQPNIYSRDQIDEFTAVSDVDALDADDMGTIDTLYRVNFGLGLDLPVAVS
jgi:aryl-alcohol dehydrogenase-like predicted oxidoreductase